MLSKVSPEKLSPKKRLKIKQTAYDRWEYFNLLNELDEAMCQDIDLFCPSEGEDGGTIDSNGAI